MEDRGVRVAAVGCAIRETESSCLSRAWVLIAFRGQNRQGNLAREMNCTNYSITHHYENWCDRWYFCVEAQGRLEGINETIS